MGTPGSTGIPCAMVLRFLSCSSRGPGFVAPVVRRMTHDLDASVGAPEPHDFAVRAGIARPAMPARPPHFFPTSVTVAKRPSCGEETGRGRKSDLPASAVSGAISVLIELNPGPTLFFGAFSSREPVSTSLENALRCCLSMISAQTHAFVVRGKRFPLFRIML
jgi:hypothetical protein